MVDPLTSEVIWQRLYHEAQGELQAGNKQADARLETLTRLKVLCDDILSGNAIMLAQKGQHDRVPFRAKKVNEKAVFAYNRMRGWKGPHPVTIRKSDGYRTYVNARENEVDRPKPTKPRTEAGREVDKAVDQIADMEARDTVRRELELGRKAKAELNNMLHLITLIPGLDLDALKENRRKGEALEFISVGIDEPRRKILLKMLVRLTDNDGFLKEFDLIFRSGRIKIGYGTGRDLIFPEEISVLSYLADFRPEPDGSEGTAA